VLALALRRAPESLRAALAGVLVFAAAAVTACGGGGGGGTQPTKVPVASIDVSPSPLSVTVGQTSPLNATTKSAAGATLTGRTVQWSSADQTVATVSTSGSVTGVKVGSTTVTATSEGIHTDVIVNVSAVPVASVDVSPSPLTVTAGQTAQLTATAKNAAGEALAGRAFTWSTADQTIATVSAGGLVSGVKVGSTTITATSEGVHKDVTVTVTPMAVATIDITPTPLTVTSGQTAQLTATPRSSGGDALTDRAITWSSADAAIADVSASGVVTGKKSGTTTVTATSDGVHKDVAVTVVAGAAASVVFVSQPRDTVAGAAIAPPVQVKVLDAQQNLVTSASTVTMALIGGATLEGALSVNTVNGVAAFSNLVIKQKGTA